MCMLDPDAPESELPCCYNIRCRYHNIGYHDRGRIAYLHPLAALAVRHKPVAAWSDDDIMRACEALPESCAVDAACEGPMSFDRIGEAMGMDGESVRTTTERLLRRVRPAMRAALRRDRAHQATEYRGHDGPLGEQLTLGESYDF